MAKNRNEKEPKSQERNRTQALTRSRDAGLAETGFSPFSFVRRFGEEMDRLFEDFGFGRDWLAPMLGREGGNGVWMPQVEILERDGQLLVRADLPGLTKDDVKVELTDHAITIEGERHDENEESGEDYYRSERSYGKFYRRLPLPEGVKINDANATFRNGVLEITLPAPKRETQKARRLEVRGDNEQKARGKAA